LGAFALSLLAVGCGGSREDKRDSGAAGSEAGISRVSWPTLPELDVYLNNSKNMDGFIGAGLNGYKSAVPGIVYAIQKSSPISPQAVNLFYVRDGVVPVPAKAKGQSPDVDDFLAKAAGKGAANNYDLVKQLEAVLARQTENNLSVFITDGLDPQTGIGLPHKLRNPVADCRDKRMGGDLHIRVYRLYSDYTGEFYHKTDCICFPCLKAKVRDGGSPPSALDLTVGEFKREISNKTFKGKYLSLKDAPESEINKVLNSDAEDDTPLSYPARAWRQPEWRDKGTGVKHVCKPGAVQRPYYVWLIGKKAFVNGAAAVLKPENVAEMAKMPKDSVKTVNIPENDAVKYGFLPKGANTGKYDIANDSAIKNLGRECWGNDCIFEFKIGMDLGGISTDPSEFEISADNGIELARSGFDVKWIPSKHGIYTHVALFSAPHSSSANSPVNISELKIVIPKNKSWTAEASVGNWDVYDRIAGNRSIEGVDGDIRKTFRAGDVFRIINDAGSTGGSEITLTFFFIK
jgi:hypothetical protein